VPQNRCVDFTCYVSLLTDVLLLQGLAKGHNIPGVGPVKVSWFTGPQSNTDAIHKSPASLDIKDDKITIRRQAQSPDPEPHLSPHAREEEVVASGWGGDGDGEEDGMGML
jgi:RNA-binding protein 26